MADSRHNHDVPDIATPTGPPPAHDTGGSIRPGTVIEYPKNDDFRLGVVRSVGHRGRLRVLGEHGHAETLGEKRPMIALGTRLTPDQTSDALVRALGTIRKRAVALADGADLEGLWSLAREAPELLHLDAAADLLFDEADGERRLAALLALRGDSVHFKRNGRHDDGAPAFEARTPEQVEAVRQQRAAEEAHRRGRQTFVDTLAEILRAPHDDRPAMLADACADEIFERYLDMLRDYAVHGDRARARSQAKSLLDDVQQKVTRRFRGRSGQRAFDALVQAGVYSEDENLWLPRFGVSTSFSDEVEAAARELAASLPEPGEDVDLEAIGPAPSRGPSREREDFTEWLTVTVDADETDDLDDALSVRPGDDGGFQVAVHIAAPAASIAFDGVLERAARERGTSLYLPDRVIPMFPRALSEYGFSLIEGAVRPAISVLVDVDMMGEIVDERVVRSWVRVDHRLNFAEVNQMLELGGGRLADVLLDLYTVAEGLHTNREMDGAFTIPLPERKVRLQPDPHVPDETRISIKLDWDTMARLMVGEMAVLTNTVAARFCERHDIPVMYRRQPPPEPPIEDDEFDDVPEGYARAIAMCRRMYPARPDPDPRPHFALGVDAYLQVTSPIRRYSDLITHFQLEHWLRDREPLLDAETVQDVQQSAAHAAGMGMRAQKATEKYWVLRYLDQKRGVPMTATVLSYASDRPKRATVMLHDCAHQVGVTLPERVPVGSEVQVQVEGANPRQGQVAVKIVDGG